MHRGRPGLSVSGWLLLSQNRLNEVISPTALGLAPALIHDHIHVDMVGLLDLPTEVLLDNLFPAVRNADLLRLTQCNKVRPL